MCASYSKTHECGKITDGTLLGVIGGTLSRAVQEEAKDSRRSARRLKLVRDGGASLAEQAGAHKLLACASSSAFSNASRVDGLRWRLQQMFLACSPERVWGGA